MPRAADDLTHRFSGKVERHDFGRMSHHVVYLPNALQLQLDLVKHPRLRIVGMMNGQPYRGACQPAGGRWYLLLSTRVLKQLAVALGDRVRVAFDVDDQDAVEVPFDLADALYANPEAQQAWDALTPGRQRGFSYRVESAKLAATREKRILEVLEAVEDLAASKRRQPR